jgi:hypothetical protein
MAGSEAIDVVGDVTDPAGTLRPNLEPVPEPGISFIPFECPKFYTTINLPPEVETLMDVFSLLIRPADIAMITKATNQRADERFWQQLEGEPEKRHRIGVWQDVTEGDIYVFLGILALMSLHPEPAIENYWSLRPGMPHYSEITQAMSRNKWQAIQQNFSINNNKECLTEFDKVKLFFNFHAFFVIKSFIFPSLFDN